MGNAASVEPTDLDSKATVKVNRKGGAGESEGGSINRIVDQYEKKQKQKQQQASAKGGGGGGPQLPNFADDIAQITGAGSPDRQPQASFANNAAAEEEDDDAQPVDILLQFIPYYGQGDPSNDSIVRATLSGLSVDDIDSKDAYGNTLLLLACQYRCEDLVRIMLGKGADPNAINSSGACCLHFACYKESSSFNSARTLLQNGANPEVAELTYGCTPLHYCAGTGEIEFCKLLLSHGAMINTMDYYNYTCVDYAREAGMEPVAAYLQARLDKFAATAAGQGSLSRGVSAGNLLSLGGAMSPAGGGGNAAAADWTEYFDAVSGGKYFIHRNTGETLWESDLKHRLQQEAAPRQVEAGVAFGKSSSKKQDRQQQQEDDDEGDGEDKAQADAWLATQAIRACLIGFLGKNDPSRLVEVENLLQQYKGKELQLLTDMCKKYDVPLEPEKDQYEKLSREMRGEGPQNFSTRKEAPSSPAPKSAGLSADFKLGQSTPVAERGSSSSAGPITPGGGGGVPGGMTSEMVQNLLNEARIKFEQQLEEQKHAARVQVAELEGEMAKQQSEIDSLRRDKAAGEEERGNMLQKLDRASAKGGESLKLLEAELSKAQEGNISLKTEVSRLSNELEVSRSKITSLESSLASLSSGKEEQMLREKKAEEARAVYLHDLQAKHSAELGALEERLGASEKKAKADLTKALNDQAIQENELRSANEAMRKANERALSKVESEMREEKARFTKMLSEAKGAAEDSKKFAEESCKRADAAEAIQRTMQTEVMEARQVQQYNERLHKDLTREQLARKRLHNEMEDMKGRIRVYVRVRPFSTSEKEKGCQEACYKDGKLSVVVKGVGDANAKKTYDFDQVFGGTGKEAGNAQKDVFRDTKHLIMSVVDGYNVCIFAYGQTGAGKSFTMIGASDIADCLKENGEFDDLAGITPRAVSELFRLLNERQAQLEFSVEVSMFQLYRDGLDDLLAEKKKRKKGEEEEASKTMKITLAEHSDTGLVKVEGAEVMQAHTPNDVMQIFARGSARRTTTSTAMNAESSRSHLICTLVVRLKNRRTNVESVGKLTLVDLAGSERVDKSGAEGEVLKEAQSINKSLSALGDVIAGLTSGAKHVPYRNHPLTMLMSDSIGGNAKTLMFVNTSPADYNSAESNSALAFASRCKDITNSVQAGPGVQAAQMNALKKQLAQLKKGGEGGGGKGKKGGALARPT